MTTIDLSGSDCLEITARRLDDEEGGIELVIETDDGNVTIDCGRFCDDAYALEKSLRDAADFVRDDILKDWQDRPDQHDGWICEQDRGGGFSVACEGTEGGVFPDRAIAVIELAEMMCNTGCFPNSWFQNIYGSVDEICDEVRAYHDDGGSGMKPLPGVVYAPGDEVLVRYNTIDYRTMHVTDTGWDPAEIVRDYGDAGIIYTWCDGEGEEKFTKDRSFVRTQDEHDFEDYRDNLLAFLMYRQKLIEGK